jgi:hypothetical protein
MRRDTKDTRHWNAPKPFATLNQFTVPDIFTPSLGAAGGDGGDDSFTSSGASSATVVASGSSLSSSAIARAGGMSSPRRASDRERLRKSRCPERLLIVLYGHLVGHLF